ncbi:hypothetical protein [Coxiella endosymbiont of Amblyomma nuttalli]|uniref:hypothetical protein n=1 Tax=Coxiella endosymbiont of Amblyomma nuttalli TaxID=2749996 RepID=UPI001BB67CF4|nr:hypothetical protein [Coxiella endosymbiont of Amblyomma nuttalli]QTS84119.1 hypothetical protein CEAn_00619 [Coxiella endosymbiont of Amblyomma nuttalli]
MLKIIVISDTLLRRSYDHEGSSSPSNLIRAKITTFYVRLVPCAMCHMQIANGLKVRIFRRFLHVGIFLVSLFYFTYAKVIARFTNLSTKYLLLIIIILVIMFEIVRLKSGLVLYGQREREAKNISSFSWTVVSLCVVLLLAPGKQYAIPITASCAFVDPLLGELRRTQLNRILIFFIGVIVAMLIWLATFFWLKIDWLLILLMGPLVVMLEWPNFRWVDDNALVQLGTLFIILVLYK